MLVTDIQKTKRGRYSIFIDEEFSGVLHLDIYYTSGIRVGDRTSISEINDLLHRSQIVIAKERALSLLSARAYTAKGLREKLLRDVDEPAAEEIILRMEELGLIDDHDYAMRYAKDCINLKGFSHKRVEQALYQRGIPPDVIQDTLLNLPEEDEEKMVFRQIRKKYLNKLAEEKDRRRTINGLMRRGFSYGAIKLVVDNLQEDANYYEDYWEE